jgi:UDP-N-acetylmuramate--alanine ligase
MSGIAEVLFNLGYKVKGSDSKRSPITERLEGLGIEVFIGHCGANLESVEVVVISSAIKTENAELRLARQKGIPIVKRAEMLAELMRLKSNIAVAGSHGKTTTTSMVAALLDGGNLDPTVINGGIIQAYGSNARLGAGDWMVVEADESDGTFTKLPATIAVVTNIDPEHMEHYGTFDKLLEAFNNFATNIPFYGAIICCTDDPDVHTLAGKISDRKVIKYGFNKQADFRVSNLTYNKGKAMFDLIQADDNGLVPDLVVPMTGEHNVLNALAAIVVARHLGVSFEVIRHSLLNFSGVKRRFTVVAEIDGVMIIEDYAHHPVEITAVLKAARQATKGRVIAVHQPHRYSRLSLLFDDFCRCFNEADIVAITEIYGANELPIKGVSQAALAEGLMLHGHRNVSTIDGELGLKNFFKEKVRPTDIFVCLGAGSISSWVNNLPEILNRDKHQG